MVLWQVGSFFRENSSFPKVEEKIDISELFSETRKKIFDLPKKTEKILKFMNLH